MPMLRSDKFVDELRRLAGKHPEYASVMNALIDLIKKGREDRIQEKLREIKDEDW